ETKRVEAEKTRVIAEDERKKAETSRQEAEDIRQNTYTNFNEAEEERRNNEISRQEAEALRIEAEKRRDDLYSQKEEERNAAFLESERTRGTAFNEAQNDRNLTFEESERVREEAFKVSEAARNEAEEGRVAAELLRVEAEKLRVAGEENRNNTFTQSEEERKCVFEEAENARKVAESKRVKAENSRIETEKLRVTAETGRVEAESLRVTAEEGRVAAETKREEGFNKFEGKINSNTEELKNARSATTGEKFNSLDERIDHEVDRLNKKIEVTMLEQEDKESHDISNTIDGMSSDMVVKGMTLNNLLVPQKANLQGGWSLQDDNVFSVESDGNGFADIRFNNLPIKPNTNYTCYIEILENTLVGEGGISIFGFSEFGKGESIPYNSKGVIKVKSLSTDKNGFYFGFYKNSIKSGNLKMKLMLIEGDFTNKSLNYFEGIKSFGQQENKISILSNGKNLFDFTKYKEKIKSIQGVVIKEDGFIADCDNSGAVGNNLLKTTQILKGYFKPNCQYFFDYKVVQEGRFNGGFIYNYTDGTTSSCKFESQVGKTINYIGFTFGTQAYGGKTIFSEIVLIEGSNKPIYEPYKCDKKDILLSQYGFDEGLRGLNNIVYDELNSIKNVAIKRVDKYIVTGNENFITDIRGDYMYCYFILEGSKPSAGVEAICNQFKYIDGLWNKDNPSVQGQEGFDLSGSNSLSFQLSINKLETHNAEGVKKHFKLLYDGGNPVEVYYWLAEPIETSLDENIKLKTFGEKTYIGFENSISGTSSFKAPVNAAATISRLNRENRALEEENKNLRQDFESTTLVLTDSDLELVKQNVDMDFRLMEVEFALDIPQAILSSDIKFKNKKGEVKSMARSPYEMMKIVILSGDYDREDYMHKVGKYYERGRMTKEEHDELMSLMTADEVISK
ncbi:hypothetical protein, partial [Clostridium perfringens]|uniref:hypothetical protein n=1 Tax=Clostridium perfringens TaxID=1502 RepID=UPI0035D4D06A